MKEITLKGKAHNPGPRFEEGFREGYLISYLDKDMCSGKHGINWGSGGGVNLGYGEGFAEGRLSGWSNRIYNHSELPEWFEEEALKYFDL